jgi:DNA invertase Pin-like site-specific DNA recombinase
MKVGYIRVSTKDQNTARQEVILKDLGVEKVFTEKVSGKLTITDRPQLESLMNFVREGDTVVVESISRYGRNIKHFLELIDILKEKQVKGYVPATGLIYKDMCQLPDLTRK